MFDFIDELRKKSPAKKKMIALTVSASITGVIFFVWISTFWLTPASNEPKKDSFADIAAPISSIKENIAEAYSSFVKIIGAGQKGQ
ncbi:MAG: hypothetical protein KGJ58_01830 [Patescibacteria group bacterium]|nr:hypothetical protein [Patescibacteria group bacterium]MDE1988522.1 hypothetical protein [Patescibacteria group bacterium]MDE2218178.1 hypothetical protein [Patescibacteria group bacterium]